MMSGIQQDSNRPFRIAILAPNESGKTCVLASLYFAIDNARYALSGANPQFDKLKEWARSWYIDGKALESTVGVGEVQFTIYERVLRGCPRQ